ncbi:hypothetical protein SOVF_198140, partial [Spinacia oleracea]
DKLLTLSLSLSYYHGFLVRDDNS